MLKRVISAVLAGFISGAGSLLAVVTEMPSGSEISDIGSITLLVIAITTFSTAAKDLHSYLTKPEEK